MEFRLLLRYRNLRALGPSVLLFVFNIYTVHSLLHGGLQEDRYFEQFTFVSHKIFTEISQLEENE